MFSLKQYNDRGNVGLLFRNRSVVSLVLGNKAYRTNVACSMPALKLEEGQQVRVKDLHNGNENF